MLLLVLGLGAIGAAAIYLFRAPREPSISPLALEVPPPESIVQEGVSALASESTQRLTAADPPPRDYSEMEGWLRDTWLGMAWAADPSERARSGPPYALGDKWAFFTDIEQVSVGGTTFTHPAVDVAELVAVTDHAYFWSETLVDLERGETWLVLEPEEAQAAADRFEAEYYARLVGLLESELQPGIDQDPRFHILHLARPEACYAGFIKDIDAYPRRIFEYSNETNVIFLNMSALTLGEPRYYSVLLHEFTHKLEWQRDANEEDWLDEALAEFVEYDASSSADLGAAYLERPGTPLTGRWPYCDEELVSANYDASLLFATYLSEQLGVDAIVELLNRPENGMSSVAAILSRYAPSRPLPSFFADWAVANLLDGEAQDGRFQYRGPALGEPSYELHLDAAGQEAVRELEPYAVNYLGLPGADQFELAFAADTRLRVVPPSPEGGSEFWYAAPSSNSDARLTVPFDLRAADEATLTFWTWYTLLPPGFAAVNISVDGGESWENLELFVFTSQRSAGLDPLWEKVEIDLEPYVGREVLIRFQALASIYEAAGSFAIQNIEIPELGYASHVDGADERWQADGFVRIGHEIAPTWEVRLVEFDETSRVTRLGLNELNQGRWIVGLGPEGGALVIVALSPVQQTLKYWLDVRPTSMN